MTTPLLNHKPFKPVVPEPRRCPSKPFLLSDLSLLIHSWNGQKHIELYFNQKLGFQACVYENNHEPNAMTTISNVYIRGIPPALLSLRTHQDLKKVQAFFHGTYVKLQGSCDHYSLDIQQKGLGGVNTQALFHAVHTGDIEMLRNVFAQDKTLLHVAKEDGTTLLHEAVLGSHQHIVAFLLEQGANYLLTNASGTNPYDLAKQLDNQDLLTLFNQAKEKMAFDQQEKSKALFKSMKNNNLPQLQTFLAQGADVNYTNKDKNSALHLAVLKRNTEAVAYLLRQGANPEQRNIYNQTPLELAQEKDYNEIPPLFAPYVKQTIDPKIAQKLEKLYLHYINEEEFAQEEQLYIPSQGKLNIHSLDFFNLEEYVGRFLQAAEQKVLLLLGDSGSGKSMFGRYLVKKHCRELQTHSDPHNNNNNLSTITHIPLFIELASLRDPVHNLIEEALQKQGFHPDEIIILKEKLSFLLFLDGYDETGSTQNFYFTNRFNQWNVKVVFTCRIQYLKEFQSSMKWFMPSLDKQGFQVLFVAPFSPDNIYTYLQKYIEVKKPVWKTVETYTNHIYRIPGLRFLVENPFILKIIAQELPRIVFEHEQKKSENPQEKQLELEKYDIYRAFVQSWFERQEVKLMRIGIKLPADVKQAFASFSKELAYNMFQKEVKAVRYVASEKPLFGQEQVSPWERFFGDKDPAITLAREGSPLRKIDPETWAFLHTELLDHFFARFLAEENPLASASFSKEIMLPAEKVSPRMFQRTKVGGRYFLMDTVHREEAAEIYAKTGYQISFDSSEEEKAVEIGRGRFGRIFIAYDEKTGYVAVKEVLGKGEMEQSDQEASLQKLAEGEHILPIYHTMQLEDRLYHFMPLALMDGQELKRCLPLINDLDLRNLLALTATRDLLRALRTIHRKRIYHLDLKPDNTLLLKDGALFLTDFGCGKWLRDGLIDKIYQGKIWYFSPERRNFQLGISAEKVDMYAAGLTIAEWCFAVEPQENFFAQKVLAQLTTQQFSPSLVALIQSLLDGDPEKRPNASQALANPALQNLPLLTQRQLMHLLDIKVKKPFPQMQKKYLTLSELLSLNG